MPSPIDRLHEDFELLKAKVEGDASLSSIADDNFRKALLLSVASYFEFSLSRIVEEFALEASGSSRLISSLVKRKAIDRQYHTWFEWERTNANAFYKLFGDQFSNFMKGKHSEEAWLTGAVQAFLEIGRSRNLLVHGNFSVFPLEKTTAEIYSLYLEAVRFVEAIPSLLRECDLERER